MTVDTNKYGLVLAGGGGKGAYQAGVFKAMQELDLSDKIAGIAGSSVGALNMCMFPYNKNGLGETTWKAIRQDTFVKFELELIDGNDGFSKRDGLIRLMRETVDYHELSAYSIPLIATVVRYDEEGLGEGQLEYLTLNGKQPEEIEKILLASSSMPWVYEPIRIGPYLYRDGGLKDNLPIKPLYDLGIRKFIVISLSPDSQIHNAQFPGAVFFHIKPSQNIGELFDGTLDFSPEGAAYRFDLGYIDGKREFLYVDLDEKDKRELAELDHMQLQSKRKMEAVEKRVADSFADISKYL